MRSNIRTLADLRASDRMEAASSPYQSDTRSTAAKVVDLIFPGFYWRSCILWVSFVQIAVYIVSLVWSGGGLSPSFSVLYTMGASMGAPIQNGEVFRLITPVFLHGSLWHILFNVYFQLRMAFPLEHLYNKWKILGVYLAAGVSGNLFSVAVAPCKLAIGASSSGFGLIGIQMAEFALFWSLIPNKEQAALTILMFVGLTVLLAVGSSAIDWLGHVGGFITGFCFGLIMNRSSEHQPTWLKPYGLTASIAALIGLFATCTAVIFAIPMKGEKGRC